MKFWNARKKKRKKSRFVTAYDLHTYFDIFEKKYFYTPLNPILNFFLLKSREGVALLQLTTLIAQKLILLGHSQNYWPNYQEKIKNNFWKKCQKFVF